MLSNKENLVIAGKYLSYYKFEESGVELREVITCVASSKEWIFVSCGNVLKYYNWKDGKMWRVIEGVFKKEEDIVYIEVDNARGEIVVIGELGSIQKRVIVSSETLLSLPKTQSSITLSNNINPNPTYKYS